MKFFHPDSRVGEGPTEWEAIKDVLGSDVSTLWYLEDTLRCWYTRDPNKKVWWADIENVWMGDGLEFVKQGYLENVI